VDCELVDPVGESMGESGMIGKRPPSPNGGNSRLELSGDPRSPGRNESAWDGDASDLKNFESLEKNAPEEVRGRSLIGKDNDDMNLGEVESVVAVLGGSSVSLRSSMTVSRRDWGLDSDP